MLMIIMILLYYLLDLVHDHDDNRDHSLYDNSHDHDLYDNGDDVNKRN